MNGDSWLERRSRLAGRERGLALAVLTSALALAAPHAMADETIGSGNGWKLVLMQGASVANGAGAAPSAVASDPAPVVIVSSAQGLAESPLPESVKQTLANSFSDPAAVAPVYVSYDVAQAIDNGTAQALYASYLVPDTAVSQTSGSPWCDTAVVHEGTIPFSKSYTTTVLNPNFSSGGFSGNLTINAPVNLVGNAELKYSYHKTAFCLPIDFKPESVRVNGSATLGNTVVDLAGSANFNWNGRTVLVSPSVAAEIPIGPWKLGVGVTFPIGAGLDIEATAAAQLSVRNEGGGTLAFDVTCKFDFTCAATPGGTNVNTINLTTVRNTSLNGQVTLQASAKPYVFVEAKAYVGSPDVLSAGAGFELSAPARLWMYYGNTCGNGTGAATSEMVGGGFFDWNAQLEFFYDWKLPFAPPAWTGIAQQGFKWIDSPIPPVFGFRNAPVNYLLRGGNPHLAYQHNIAFSAFSFAGNASPFSPIFTGPTTLGIGQTGNYTLAKRPCLPLDAPLDYRVDWGDGVSTPLAAGAALTASHAYTASAVRTASAVMVNDIDGRTINAATAKTVTIQPTPWLPASITVPPADGDGSFAVSWAASPDATSYELQHMNNGGAYSALATRSSTAINLVGEPTGMDRYRVRACNLSGCSDWRESTDVAVGIAPAVPTLTVLPVQCANELSWTVSSNATNYRLFTSTGTDPNVATPIWTGTTIGYEIVVTKTTNVWVKACNENLCSAFSNRKSVGVKPACQ